MNTKTQKIIAFLVGCIGIRLLFVLAAATLPSDILQFAGLLAIILATCWVLIYRFNLRPTGWESTDPDGKIWWTAWRPIHACLYAAFAILAITKSPYAWAPLALDVVIAMVAWGSYHTRQ